jgi:hypothetical protein
MNSKLAVLVIDRQTESSGDAMLPNLFSLETQPEAND